MAKMMGQMKSMLGTDVGGCLDKIKNSGLSEHFKSWVGKGENKPVTADQVTEALGNEHMAKIADQTGVSQQQAAQTIADKLPGMVDKMTPEGNAGSLAGVGSKAQSMMQGATDKMRGGNPS
jgi:uncharacterized protein YidB (DUF937 family)